MLIINCIYKINRYDMFLCIIFEMISLNNKFYVAFAFLSSENFTSFAWVMKQIEKLYKHFNIFNSSFFEIDCEFNLINVIFLIFLMLNMFYSFNILMKTLSKIANLLLMMMNHEKLFININMMSCTQKSRQYTKKFENLYRISMNRIIIQWWIIYEMNY
jgi:hypothetical protein